VAGLTLRFGDETVRVLYPGPSHAPDEVVVHFPSLRVLFGGCSVIGRDRLGNLADADLARWPAAIERLRGLDATLIIPGHGDRTDPGLLEHTIRLVRGAPRPR
jgi:glyoxylase-like metal-dependent hydrolase (beta-lactamase superfamily II)